MDYAYSSACCAVTGIFFIDDIQSIDTYNTYKYKMSKYVSSKDLL